MIRGFQDRVEEVNGQRVAFSIGGDGPPVLLLHGFPQTRAMWHEIAPRLAESHTVIAADLRGYGESSKPVGVENYAFREMGADQFALMRRLGHPRFHLLGHDRGARTAHRMALDVPDAIASLTLMDIVPTHLLLRELRRDVAASYYHWFFLAQPAPLPERMIGGDPDYFYESCLLGWGGSSLRRFDAEALMRYRESWRRPDTIRAMCDDYRATFSVDYAMDEADLGRRVTCPSLVLYGSDGAMARAYDVPACWAERLGQFDHDGIPGGHFFPDTAPIDTADRLLDFLGKHSL